MRVDLAAQVCTYVIQLHIAGKTGGLGTKLDAVGVKLEFPI